jgi:hypothetical protein
LVIYKLLAKIEAEEAYQWDGQSHIAMGNTFLDELEGASGFIAGNPQRYA